MTHFKSRSISLAFLACLASATPLLHATDFTWIGTAGNWSNPVNWQNNMVPANDPATHVILAPLGNSNFTSTIDSSRTTWIVNGLTFNHASNSLNADTLTIDPASTLQFAGTSPFIEQLPAHPPLVINGAIDLANGLTIKGSLSGQTTLTLNGSITGSGGIVVNNPNGGNLTFAGSNSFTGGITVNATSHTLLNLNFNSVASLPSGDLTINYVTQGMVTTTFQVAPGNTTTIANNIIVNGLSSLAVPFGVTFKPMGATADDTIILQHLSASGNAYIPFANASVGKTTWNIQALTLDGNINLSGDSVISGANIVINSITESAPSSLILSGSNSTFHLTGSNTYSAGTTISANVFAEAGGSLGSGAVTINDAALSLNATNAANNSVTSTFGNIAYNANGAAGGHVIAANSSFSNIMLGGSVTSLSNGSASDTFSLAAGASLSGAGAQLALLDRGIGSGTTPNFTAAAGVIIENTDGNLPTIQNLGNNADLILRIHTASPINLTLGTGTPWLGLSGSTFVGAVTANSNITLDNGTFGDSATAGSFNILPDSSPVVVTLQNSVNFNSSLSDFSGVQMFVSAHNSSVFLNVANALGGAAGTSPVPLDLQEGQLQVFSANAVNGPLSLHAGDDLILFTALSGSGIITREAGGITFDIRTADAFTGAQLTPAFTTAADTLLVSSNNIGNFGQLNPGATFTISPFGATQSAGYNLNGGKLILQSSLQTSAATGANNTIAIGTAGESISGTATIPLAINAQGAVSFAGSIGLTAANQFTTVNLTQGELASLSPASLNGAAINLSGGTLSLFQGVADLPTTYSNSINVLQSATIADNSRNIHINQPSTSSPALVTLQSVNLSAATLTLNAENVAITNLTLLGDATLISTVTGKMIPINTIGQDASARGLTFTQSASVPFYVFSIAGSVQSTGPISISNLGVDFDGSVVASASPITLDTSGRLAGVATIHRPVIFSAGATSSFLSPGSLKDLGDTNPGTLTVDSLILSANTTLQWNLSTPNSVAGPDNDLLADLGDLTLDGTLAITPGPNFATGSFTLLTYDGQLTDNGLALPTAPAGLAYSLDLSTPHQINLLVTSVPEPATLALLGLPALFLRRKRRPRPCPKARGES